MEIASNIFWGMYTGFVLYSFFKYVFEGLSGYWTENHLGLVDINDIIYRGDIERHRVNLANVVANWPHGYEAKT